MGRTPAPTLDETRFDIPDGSVRVLSARDVETVLDWPSVVRAVEESHRLLATRRWVSAPETNVHGPARSRLRVLAGGRDGDVLGTLTYVAGAVPGDVGLRKACLLYDARGGRLRAIIDAERTAWMRAGATAAVAARHLARGDATRFGVVGAGRLAHAIVLACAAEFPDCSFSVAARSDEGTSEFASTLSREIGRAVEVRSVEAVARSSDVLATATTSATPVVLGEWVPAGAHVNAMGAHHPTRREIDSDLVAASVLFVDDRERAMSHDGDLLGPMADGSIPDVKIAATLGEVVAGVARGRTRRTERTVFSSGGIASEHLAVAALALERAETAGVGTVLDFPADERLPARRAGRSGKAD